MNNPLINRMFSVSSEEILGDKTYQYSVTQSDTRYFISYSWEGAAQGSVGVVISNDKVTSFDLPDNAGGVLESSITSIAGANSLADYVGVTSRYIGIKFTGVSGTFNWTINFTT